MKARIFGLVTVGAGCIAALPAFASPNTDGVPHAQYSSMETHGDAIRGSDFSHKTRHLGTSDFQRVDDHAWGGPRPPMEAPEIDHASAAVALTLLMGGLAFLRARRRKT